MQSNCRFQAMVNIAVVRRRRVVLVFGHFDDVDRFESFDDDVTTL